VVAVLALLAGAGVVGYALLRGEPAGQAALDAVGLGDRKYTQADVDAALLTIADLPGYSVSPPEEDSLTNEDMVPCGKTLDVEAPSDGQAMRESSFAKSALGPLLNHSVTLYDDAAGYTQLVRSTLAGCTSWTQPNGDPVTLAEANYGSFGDETYSFKLSMTSDGFQFGAAFSIIRVGNLLSLVVMAGFSDVSGDDAMAAVAAAAAKLP
jgi:hypothetical protein